MSLLYNPEVSKFYVMFHHNLKNPKSQRLALKTSSLQLSSAPESGPLKISNKQTKKPVCSLEQVAGNCE